MDQRALILGGPSALILAGLVWHSSRAMVPRRALAFWISVIVYGVLRGSGVRIVTELIGASFPYEIRNPLLSVAGVSAQEVAGWAVVAYLGWWIGARRHLLFVQIAWASLFLGAIAWAIESAAIAARWWHWTVPTASRIFLNVPAIGIVDWFFVGIDFLLPFAAMTARWRWRYLTLLFFPVHFGGHLLPDIWLHVVHWALVMLVAWLALSSDKEDQPFAQVRSWLPTASLALIVLDVALVQVFVAARPDLLLCNVAVVVIWLAGLRRAAGDGSGLLTRHRAIAIGAIAVFAVVLHTKSARDRADLTRRLDDALAARNRGEVLQAKIQFDGIARDHPTDYVPFALAAEIDYRSNQFGAAREKLIRAVEIKQDFVRGYRLLAAIDRQEGRSSEWAELGLEVAPDDLQLQYLAGKDVGGAIRSPAMAAGMVALAYEVGDLTSAQQWIESARHRWPSDERLRAMAGRLEVSSAR